MSVVANVAINVDAANAIQQLNRVKTATDAGQKSLIATSTAAKGLGAALATALGPIIGVTTAIGALGKSLQVFQDRQADIAVLRNGLTGLVNDVGGVTEGLRVLADEFGKATLFNEEDFIQGSQLLTSFRDIAVSSYGDVIGAAADVAQVTGTDVNSALLQLAKALQDPVAGLSALSRSGIQFTDTQKETIKSLVEAGNAAGAQALILGELQAQYGGAAEAAGSAGLAGALDTLGERANDAFELLGKALEPALAAGITFLSEGVQKVADAWSFLGSEIFPQVQAALQPVIDALRSAFEGIDFDTIRVVIQNILIKGFEVALVVIKNFSGVLATVINGFKALSQTPVFKFIAEQVGNVANLLGLTNDKVGEFKNKQEEAANVSKDVVAEAVNLTNATDKAAVSQKELNEKNKEILQTVQLQSSIKEQLLDNEININKALGNNEATQKAILAKIEQSYQSRLNELSVLKEQGKISDEQFSLESSLALIKKEGATSAAKAEEQQRKQNEQLKQTQQIENAIKDGREPQLQQKIKELQAQKEIANTLEQVNTLSAQNAENETQKAVSTLKALSFKREQVDLEFQLSILGKETNAAFVAAAEALRQAKIESIGISENLQQALLTAERLKGVGVQTPIPDVFGEAGKNAVFVEAFRNAVKELRLETNTVTTSQIKYNETLARFLKLAEQFNRIRAQERRAKATEELTGVFGFTPFASGGYVTKPTRALIGEAGEPEYVIPSSKMDTAMANYAAGRRGGSVLSPQVNITTGPVTQIDGTNFVTITDLRQATSAAARQGASLALSQLQNNPQLRRSIGVSR